MKKTLLLSNKNIDIASKIIKKGGLVAFPTETVYGLGANALDQTAVCKIFKAKGRPIDNPLIVHISSKSQLSKLVKKIPIIAKRLIKEFWPGPLTLIFEKKQIVPNNVTCGLDTVAIRMPNNKIALNLIKKSATPIAAPSANLSGRPSPTMFKHVIEDLDGKIDAIIDGGKTKIGLESTVLDITKTPALILRPGGITKEMIEKVIGKVELFEVTKPLKNPPSPGLKYRHYAPKAKIILIEYSKSQRKTLNLLLKHYKGQKVAIMTTRQKPKGNFEFINLGKREISSSRKIFSSFRELDKKGIRIILFEGLKDKNLATAIMNRVRKASYKIIN
ncbi:MAG TPA: L-threonylcarbamoyladenylate synthase [Candidatus Woesearchaeota archaeon]|nr:L-threonylcarbamoyladenylate synthase [Candidatus Woesearchaeota archaeon]